MPLRSRLHALWEGYEWRQPPVPPRPGSDGDVQNLGPSGSRLPLEDHTVGEGWPQARIAINQVLWGDGFLTPGGEEAVAKMIAPLGLTKAHSVIDLGTGIGGSTRCIAKVTGAWVSGYEEDGALAKVAMQESTAAGLCRKAPISHGRFASINIRRRTIDCVFSKEALFTVADKPQLFEIIREMFKAGGQLLFTDYFAARAAATGPAVEVWAAHEPEKPVLWSVDEARAALEGRGFEVRITEDLTGSYRERVNAGFSHLLEGMDKKILEPELISWLVAEAEHWARRVAVLDSGEVKVFRVYACVPQ